MPGKRKTRASGNQVGAQRVMTVQATLKDLFQRTNSAASSSIEQSQGSEPEHTDTVTPLQTADTPILVQPSETNSAANKSMEKLQDLQPDYTDSVASSLQLVDTPLAQPSQPSKPSQLFPIFTRVSAAREKRRATVNSVDDIDIIDLSSDAELSTEPYLSPDSPLTPFSEFSQATLHSRVPSTVAPDDRSCEEDDTPSYASLPKPTPHKQTKIKCKGTPGLGGVAPFPSSCSQHVRGLQQSYTSSQAPLKRRIFPSLRTSDEGTLDFLARWRQVSDTPPPLRMSRSWTPQQCEEHLHSLSHNYAESHPAFARTSIHQEKVPETWTRRFRPRRADEVLGNEQHALYLRDWLNALALRLQDRPPDGVPGKENKEKRNLKRARRGTKRPHVIRAVARRGNKKRRMNSYDDLDDFVARSDEEEEEPPEDSEDEFTFCQRTFDRLRRRETGDTDESHAALDGTGTTANHAASRSQGPVHAKFTDKLTNTILITGPPGCGKTAAVYACAEELGWEVFEVYPGIGKRNGASLEQLVGDVGKNHTVQTVHRRGPMEKGIGGAKGRVGLDGYLTRGESKTEESGSQGEPIEIDDREVAEPLEACGRRRVGQSLVLLEEVDILFKDDAGFWPAVIEFIRSCQRPVVMTCNDAGLVPVGELPVQSILIFEPCPSRVAASFLQCLSLTEGKHVAHEDLVRLYERTQCVGGVDTADALLYPRMDPIPLPDLRRSIMQLQILCADTSEGDAEEEAGDDRRSGRAISADEWVEMKRASEVMSHVDAQVRCVSMVEVTDEEEVGYVVLRGEEEMSRGVHEETGPMEASISDAFRARVAYQTRMVDALQGVVGPGDAMVPQRGVFLDYIPWVRYMAAVEDEQRGGGGGGRRTRNSMGVRGVRRGELLKW